MIQNGYNDTTGVYTGEGVVPPCQTFTEYPPCYKPKCSNCTFKTTCANYTPEYNTITFTSTTTGEFYS